MRFLIKAINSTIQFSSELNDGVAVAGCSCTFNGSLALSGVHVRTAMEAPQAATWMDGAQIALASGSFFSNYGKLGIRGDMR